MMLTPTRSRSQHVLPIRFERLEDRLAPAVIFTETFDATAVGALPAGWTANNSATSPAPLWTVDNAAAPGPPFAHTGSKSAYIDDPASLADKRLVSPAIPIPNSPGVQLRFRHRHDFEVFFGTPYDGGVLEIAIPGVAGGAFQDIQVAGGSFAIGGYTGVLANSGNVLANRQAWTASTAAFITTTVNLPTTAQGKSVQFRWRMGSDEIDAGIGWRVDTVEVGTPTFSLSSGNNQAVRVTNPFAAPLAVRLVSEFGAAVPGVTVTFTAPANGATAIFTAGNTAVTDNNGIASVPVQANAIDGAYTVTATIAGIGDITFNLTNTPNQLPVNVSPGGPYLFPPGLSITFTATATDPDNDALLYSWDLNGDGTFGDAVGPVATFPPVALTNLGIVGGFRTDNLRVRVTDPFGSVVSDPTTLHIILPPPPPPVPTPLTVVGAGPGGGPHVRVFNKDGSERFSFFAFDAKFAGGVNVGTGDVTGDLVEDVVVAANSGGGPHVKVFDGVTGAEIRSFFAYDVRFAGGVSVAAGDIDGDGFADIITGAGPTGGPHVKVFSGKDGGLLRSFFPLDLAFRGGVNVAAGDLDGDFKADIITAAATAAGTVRAYSGASQVKIRDFNAFDLGYAGGVNIAASDIDGDSKAEVLLGQASGGTQVSLLNGAKGAEIFSGLALSGFTGGVRVALSDIDNDGVSDVLASTGPGRGSLVRQFRITDGSVSKEFAPFGGFGGGVSIG